MNNVKTRKVEEKDNLTMYLREMKNIPMLTRVEEEITARAAAAGDKTARERLVNANLRFVVNPE